MKQGSAEWNDELFLKHPTPYTGISGKIEYKRAKRIYKLIKKFTKKRSINSIIEIGCEQGNLLKFLNEKFPETKLYGTDISGVALERASQSLPKHVVLMENDITQETPKIAEHDVLICSEVLEHIPDDTKAMQELYRVMKPGGYGIFQIPQDLKREVTFEDDSITDKTERAKIFGQYDHVRVYGRDYFDKLRSIGFKVEETDYTSQFSEEEIKKYCLAKGEIIPVVFK